MASKRSVGVNNKLLAALPIKERNLFIADGTIVDMALGSVIYEQGERIRHVYFPTESFISMLSVVDGKSMLEVGMIGTEGMCGHSLLLGENRAPLRALTQGSGTAWRMSASLFREKLGTLPTLRKVMGRYVTVIFRQLAQTAACTRFHVVENRLARWLLMTRDRAHADSFEMTQDFLAYMLGVRRSGVSYAAGILQSRQLIRYSRGSITILDLQRLEACACTCYQSDLDIYAHGMGLRRSGRIGRVPAN